MNIGLLKNVIRLLRYIPDALIVVVDNSPEHYKRAHRLSQVLNMLADKQHAQIKYIEHHTNSRFAAYNAGMEAAEADFVIFRTDDDYFDEQNTAQMLDQKLGRWAVTPHFFNNSIQYPRDHCRPLETAIFTKAFLTSLLPFADMPAADWQLLERAYGITPPAYFTEPVLHKAGHGRNAKA